MAVVVDAHQHFWRIGAQEQAWRDARHEAINSDFDPADLAESLHEAGVQATVLMQSVDEPAENDRLQAYAETTPFVAGVVGWLPLRDPKAAHAELSRTSIPRLCGVRCLVADDPLEWLSSPDSLSLFRDLVERGLAWDVVPINGAQIESVLRLAHELPDLKIVVDHLGRPPVEAGTWRTWAKHVQELSDCPGVAMKVSIGIDVLSNWDHWQIDKLDRFVEWAMKCFGPNRLMMASNWPVVLLRTTYTQAWSDLSVSIRRCVSNDHDFDMISGGTASHWYRLARQLMPSVL